ncbi:hypothetical protein KS4_01210 [Poriferisphaera corsica]|uniref:Ice-binding protein C-terminal domain-containing protein n=1 Tax=Poriferisphaera corsica TaxID=2528020 RepID=A0A517YPG0_9BACT|nr:PEP-CTERM sorting domain-containing protein [Poriferisphaera corsica]QDU32092.1 hypothetical protein KS4_01210 [Poriferisphaera corsica]
MKNSGHLGAALVAGMVFVGVVGGVAEATPVNFVDPGEWSVGSSGSTYQAWDVFTGTTGNGPDVGYNREGDLVASSGVQVSGPYVASSGNFYGLFGEFDVTADVVNASGGSGTGTHVVVQMASTSSADEVKVFNGAGEEIAGAVQLRSDELGKVFLYNMTPPGSSTPVPIYSYEDIYEFYLPDYVGDYQIVASYAGHSSFDGLRIDSYLTDSAMSVTVVPEPAAVALLGLGGLMILQRRRKV